MNFLVVLGIDPGYAIVGYGAIKYDGMRYSPLGFGAITTDAEQEFSLRLERIYDSMCDILQKYRPDVMSVEKLYFQTNQKTAIMVAEARGVILLSARKFHVPVFEYTPLQVKTAVTGYGKAQKYQVMEMTRRLLNLKSVPKPDDTADALAIAIAHTQAAGTDIKKLMINRRSRF